MKAKHLVWAAAVGMGLSAGAATYEVTDAGDSGAGTLRWALEAAHTNAGADEITFNLVPPYRIQPLSGLPYIDTMEGLTVDGTSQPGYAGTPLVELDGSAATGATRGLHVMFSSNVVIRGLAVLNWTNGISMVSSVSNRIASCLVTSNQINGIYVTDCTNCLFGGSDGGGNWLVDNRTAGIYLYGGGNRIEGNWAGTDGAAARPNSVGVYIWGGESNVIGGSADGAGNVIGGNDSYGINLAMWASNNLIQGNWIGTDESGTNALNNSIGVYVGGPDNQIGGAGAGEGNWICGNTYGIRVIGSYGVRAVIEGNSVGQGAGGVPVPNEYGVQLFTASNRVGSTVVNGGNLIAANATTGIEISGSDSFGNEILGNRIGEDSGNGRYGISVRSPGTVVGGLGAGAGNIVTSNEWDGILLSGADAVGCRVEGNLVAYNGDAGIQVLDSGSVSNLISQNSIFLNGKLGIDIGNTGVTTNDPGDGDAGANGLQNFPVLTLASNAGATLAIGGYLDSSPGEEFMIEFFDSPECDSSGYGEGATYLGQQIVNTDGGGMASFTNAAIPAPAIPPSFVTATARRTASKETSEFSRYLLVDSDGDGMPDGWEFIYFGSITGAAPDGHGDGDPFTNLEEFRADTDPTDADDYPRFAGIVNEGDWIRVDMETAPSRMYRLEDQDAADDDAWASRLTDLEGTGRVVSWIWVYSDTTTVFRCWAYLP